MSPYNPWFSLCAGILFIVSSLLSLPEKGGEFEGFPIPAFGGWLLLLLGAGLVLLSGRALLHGGGKESPPSDEDVAAGLKELERMYVKEHGVLPDYAAKQENGITAGVPAFGSEPGPALSSDAKEPKERERG